jgi:hypothetical protein
MNFNRFLSFAFTGIAALFFLLCGLMVLVLPWSHAALEMAVNSIHTYRWLFTFFGIGLLLVSIALFGQIYLSSQRKYLSIRTGDNPIDASDAVIRDTLKSYWENLFPDQEIPCKVDIKKNRIFLSVDLPYYPKEKQSDFLKKIERELSILLKEMFAYTKSLHLKISFDRESA